MKYKRLMKNSNPITHIAVSSTFNYDLGKTPLSCSSWAKSRILKEDARSMIVILRDTFSKCSLTGTCAPDEDDQCVSGLECADERAFFHHWCLVAGPWLNRFAIPTPLPPPQIMVRHVQIPVIKQWTAALECEAFAFDSRHLQIVKLVSKAGLCVCWRRACACVCLCVSARLAPIRLELPFVGERDPESSFEWQRESNRQA